MALRRLAEIAAVLLACVVSGTLECSHHGLTVTERQGQELYLRTCAVCHARTGDGYAADQAPALANADFLASVPDNSLRRAIMFGRTGTTMSAWSSMRGGPLDTAGVDAVIAFIRAWEHGPRATLDERPVTGDTTRGAAAYAQRCAGCHGSDGTNGTQIHIGGRDFLASASNGYLRYAISRGRTGTPMAAFAKTLGDGGIEDVVAFVRNWQFAPSSAASHFTPPPPVRPLPLGPVPIYPHGPEPVGFRPQPATTPADAVKAQLDRGARRALLDARAPSDYVNEHIAGAVSVPFYDPDPYTAALPKDAWLVCYCACPHAESGQLAQKLVAKGFTKVTVLDEGLGVWRSRKYPTHKGEAP